MLSITQNQGQPARILSARVDPGLNWIKNVTDPDRGECPFAPTATRLDTKKFETRTT
jgi:hypothetical protein